MAEVDPSDCRQVAAHVERLKREIDTHIRAIWWANLWLGYTKVCFGFYAACLIFGPRHSTAMGIVCAALQVPLFIALFIKDWISRKPWLPKAK